MAGLCEGRVVIVTGAGRGIGRGHALEFGRQGASVVVNDIGAAPDGSGNSPGPAGEVVETIRAMGGQAIANGDDVADFDGAATLIETALDHFGRLDTLVNNAGIVRDRMIVNMTEDDWDAAIRVHLKGTFAPVKHASSYWRRQFKDGHLPQARVINTSSGAGLQGSVGQANYSAAKAGIAAFTLVAAAELARYGVTVNAIAPSARTRMTEEAFAEMMAKPATGFDPMNPDNVAPLVAWLGSERSRNVTGRVFEVAGGMIGVAQGWRHGPEADKRARWDPNELDDVIADLLGRAEPPIAVFGS